MPNKTKFIAVGRGASTVISHLPEIGISKDRCLSAVPVIKEEHPFLNSVWVDLNFEIDEQKQKIGEELYKVSLSCESEIDKFLTDAEKLIIVCCIESGISIRMHYADLVPRAYLHYDWPDILLQ